MSDDEDVVSGMAAPSGPSEAELAMQKRRKGNISTADLDEAAQELLEENRKERARMEEEIQELRQRSEQRKKERIEQEKEMAVRRAEDEARRKAEEEERKSKKEAEDNKRKAARDAKMAEFESKKNPQKPNFVISKKTDLSAPMVPLQDAEDEERADKKSKEQMEAEKRAILAQRIRPLEISGFDNSKLTEKAKELNGLIHRLESEKYDLEKRFKDQQYDMMELAERARQMNQVGRGGLKRINLGPDESDPIQEKFAGAPAKVEMYSKFERQQDKRKYCERHQVFKGETWIAPPKRISPHRVLKWDENTGLPSYQFLPGMEPKEEEGEQEE